MNETSFTEFSLSGRLKCPHSIPLGRKGQVLDMCCYRHSIPLGRWRLFRYLIGNNDKTRNIFDINVYVTVPVILSELCKIWVAAPARRQHDVTPE